MYFEDCPFKQLGIGSPLCALMRKTSKYFNLNLAQKNIRALDDDLYQIPAEVHLHSLL